MAGSTLYRDYDYDYNTLISPDLGGNEWRRDTNTPSLTPTQAFSSEIGIEHATAVNIFGVAQARGLVCTPLVIPAGVTGGILEMQAAARAASGRVNLCIYDDTLTNRLFEQDVTFTTSVSAKQLLTTLGPGQYFAAFEVNHAAQQAQLNVWDIRYTPNFSTVAGSVFAKAFKRFRPRAGLLHGNIKSNWIVNRYMNQSAYSRWMFKVTGATRCAVRTWIQNGAPITTPTTFYVQSEAIAKSASSQADLTYSCDEYDIPQRAPTMTVGFKTAIQSQWVATSNHGSFFVDAFFPADADVEPIPPPASTRRIVLVGDSITLGATATCAESQGWSSYLETRYPGLVLYEAASSRWFQQMFADAATSAASAQEIAKAAPTEVLIQIAVNDYLNNAVAAWTPATIETASGVAYDAIHAAMPEAIVNVVSPFLRGGTDTAINGLTMAQVRTAQQNAATNASRTAWCRFKSGVAADMPTASFIQVDNTHLTTDGHAVAGAAIAAFLGV